MNARQETVLKLIHILNDTEFTSWFDANEVMAFVDCESSFRAHAYRYEPRLGEGSYGLMQVLASTARSVDSNITDPEMMYDPAIGLRTGMKVAKSYWDQLTKHLGKDPSLEEWAASYNEGVGGVLRDDASSRDPDPAYTVKWMAAYNHWGSVIYAGEDKGLIKK